MKKTGTRRNRSAEYAFVIAVLACATLYAALSLSPSSYAAAFDELGVERFGLVAGEPRLIRADEWRRWTPFFQIAVNNDFRRINETSVYREDLLNVEGLPLGDWGLFFKPYFHLFFVADPAFAFSFHHAFWIAACLIGYERLFRHLGMRPAEAAAGSVALFFTSFFQTWWTTYGPVVAGFPWLVLTWLVPMPAWLRVPAAAYVTVAWLLASLYPPIQVTCGFLAGVAVLAWRREAFAPRQLAPFAAGVGMGGAVAFLYYRDVFATMASTVYPGLRREGGGGVPVAQWWSHFAPSLVVSGDVGLVNENVCEASTVGSFLPLLLLCCVDWPAFGRTLGAADEASRRARLELGVLLAGALATSLWLLAPVPAAVGMPLLWHVVPGKRMWFAAGIAILLLSFGVIRHAKVSITGMRVAAAATLAVVASLVAQRALGRPGIWDAATLAFLISLGSMLALRGRLRAHAGAALIACAAIANAAAFGGFNPLQSAQPIFHLPELPVRASLDRLASRHEKGWLVLHGTDGAILNGLGYRSVAHVLYAPQLDWFRPYFPDLPPEEFDHLFNRTMYPFLTARRRPALMGDAAMWVPIDLFDPPRIATRLGGIVSADLAVDGSIEDVWVYAEYGTVHVIVDGWAYFDGSRPDARLDVFSALPVASMAAFPALRGDSARQVGDPALALSGFELRLTLATKATEVGRPLAELVNEPLCIVSNDPTRGRRLLRGGFAAADCPTPAGAASADAGPD